MVMSVQHVPELGKPLAQVDHRRREGLPAGEGEKLPGQALAAAGGVGDHIEQPRMLRLAEIAPQALHAAADDHQEIVEVMRNPAGQLPDGPEMLRLPQRVFRSLAAIGLGMQLAGALQRHADDHEQQERRRQAEDQMARHGRQPFRTDGRSFDSGDDVDRETSQLAKSDPPLERVGLGTRHGIECALLADGDGDAKGARGIERPRVVAP
jgi:hypothetical protein